MRLSRFIFVALLLSVLGSGLLAFQRDPEYDDTYLPQNSHDKAEWVFARFHYSSGSGNGFGGFRGFQRWAADYPKSDRQFVQGVHRLTRIDTRTIEQVVDADSDEIFNWPWVFVEDPGAWSISQEQAKRMREYLLRGGFLFLDDTHGDPEWANMVAGMRLILPGAQIEDLTNQDEIFHVLYDLDDRFQIPGTRYIWGGRSYTPDSATPHWRAIRDSTGRIIVAICHNSDVGDAWEWADSPRYPERATSLAFRLGINYIIYGMTH
jgi:Domain of unknown function (DUF4159)